MKKFISTLVLISLFSVYAMADGIKVTQGDKKLFKNAEGNAQIEIVLDGATYDGQKPLKEKFEDLANFKKCAIEGFTEGFNDKSKKVKIAADNVKYKIAFKVSKVDQYFKVMGFVPGNATKVWGEVTITDAASGETLAVINVDEVDGGANLSPDGTISDSFKELAELIAKLK